MRIKNLYIETGKERKKERKKEKNTNFSLIIEVSDDVVEM